VGAVWGEFRNSISKLKITEKTSPVITPWWGLVYPRRCRPYETEGGTHIAMERGRAPKRESCEIMRQVLV